MRVVAGRFGGRPLATPANRAIRPTSDRVREAVFNILAHGAPAVEIEGCRVIDLFAGTGALGVEALSRGAAFCLFVEEDAEARGLIRRNVEAFGLTGTTKIFRRDATQLGLGAGHGPFDLAFLDPPYGKGLAERALTSLEDGWLRSGAVAVVEEAAGAEVLFSPRFTPIDERNYGETRIVFLRHDG